MSQLEQDNILILRENQQVEDLHHRISGGYYCFSERDSVMKAVSKNMGYTVLPGMMALDNLYLETGLISALPIADGVVPVTMYLAYSSAVPLSASEQEVVKLIYTICRDIQKKLRKLPTAPAAPFDKNTPPPSIYY